MQCSGLGRTLDQCYAKASEICPGGYNIVDRASSVSGSGNVTTTRQTLFVECR
jgi:hypothetical protein